MTQNGIISDIPYKCTHGAYSMMYVVQCAAQVHLRYKKTLVLVTVYILAGVSGTDG